MKKIGISIGLIGLTALPLMAMFSCSMQPDNPDDIDTEVTIEPYWTLNYVFDVRPDAPFKLDFNKPSDNLTATIRIVDQKLDDVPTQNCLKFSDSQKDVISLKINKSTKEIKPNIELVSPSLFDGTHEVSFSLKITLSKSNAKKEITIDNLWLMVAKPAYQDDFFKFADADKTILTGLTDDPTKLEELNHCNMLIIPNSVKEIAAKAFKKSGSPTSTLPSNLKWLLLDHTWGVGTGTLEKIGDKAFIGAPFTGILRFPNALTEIGTEAFKSSKFTGSIEFPDSVIKIGQGAFSSCGSFDGTVSLPKNTIGDGALGASIFLACNHLIGDVVIPETWTSIPNSLFSSCSNLNGEIVLPDSIKSIGQYAFSECSKLSGQLLLPNQLETIGQSAFNNCSSLTGDLIIPETVSEINQRAFYNCSGFDGSLSISNNVENLPEYLFYNCSSLTGNLVLPENLKSIGDCVFWKCTSLSGGIKIPSKVSSIGTNAFKDDTGFDGCLTIPYSIDLIKNSSFNGCSNIKEIDLSAWETIPEQSYTTLFYGFNTNGGIVWIKSEQDPNAWIEYLKSCGLPNTWECRIKG